MNRFMILILSCFALAGCGGGQSVTVNVVNNSDFDRQEEMVELAADDVFGRLNLDDDETVVVFGKEGEVAYQLTHDGKIIFPVSVGAKEKAVYTIKKGSPSPVVPSVSGRQYPERLDDIAWENDRSGYRLYGPGAFTSGGTLYGYDIFTKNVPRLVLEERYALDLSAAHRQQIKTLREAGRTVEADSLQAAISYHVDHGEGMDAYDVGPTLGAGTAALLTDTGEMLFPKEYVDYEVLDNGPLRFTVRLTYAPQPNGAVETRVIELDKGSYLNRTTVRYDGIEEPNALAAGCVIHRENPEGYEYSADEGFIAYADSTNNPRAGHGVVFIGLVFPTRPADVKVEMLKKPAGSAIGHVIAVTDYQPQSDFTYYWGSGWSHAGIPDIDSWTEEMRLCVKKLREPLEVVY